MREQNPVKRAGIRWRKQESGEESRDSVREQNPVKKARTEKHSEETGMEENGNV
ncbi:hypothetical protein [[Clostridium] aminophilum]|uniref:hypothetical protein n=1 Tax=[Clostridium] aminophilum TaxID=1526 RepID=UPI0015A59B35|nr:hypothetical protein [[Clostridium] aminophilum]